MIQESHTSGAQSQGTDSTSNVGVSHVNPALRSNIPSALPQHVTSARLRRSASPVTHRVTSPSDSVTSVKSQSPHLQSSLSSTDGAHKSMTGQLKLQSDTVHSESLSPGNTVNVESVPRTHASNKRFRKKPPVSETVSRKRGYLNGQASQPDLHAEGSRDSVSGLSHSSSSCELFPTLKVPILESTANTSVTVRTSSTVTSTVTTSANPSVVCTSIIPSTVTSKVTASATRTKLKEEEEEHYKAGVAGVFTPTISPAGSSTSTSSDFSSSHIIVTTCITMTTATAVCTSSSFSRTNSLFSSPRVSTSAAADGQSNPVKARKKRVRLTCLTDGTVTVPPVLMGDILKEKLASKSRSRKVKTTKELVAFVQGKPMPEDDLDNSSVPTNSTSLTKESISEKYKTPGDALQISKSEHIAKYLQSQSEIHHMHEDPTIAPLEGGGGEGFTLQKMLMGDESAGGAEVENSTGAAEADNSTEIGNSSVGGMSSLTRDVQSSKDSESGGVIETQVHDQTVEELLAQLPPIDPEAICWDDMEADSEPPEKKEVTEEDITRLHTEQIEGLNGNINEGAKPGEIDFREWHQTVSKKSYQGELLHILPYTVID